MATVSRPQDHSQQFVVAKPLDTTSSQSLARSILRVG
jgi:hypothetical protein